MPKRNYQWAFLLTSLILMSCDPGIGVAIVNQSTTEKHLTVYYPPTFKFKGERDANHVGVMRDSIKIYDLTKTDYYFYPNTILKTSRDTTKRTYSFLLKPNQKAIVESRFLATVPTFGQIFIIDNKDTIELKARKNEFRKRPKLFLGGEWTYTIKD